MSAIERSHGASGRHGDLMICGEFSYDAENGSLAWSATAGPGPEIEPADLLDLDGPPIRDAIDLSIREGTPFSLGRSVTDAGGVTHEVVLCGLPETHAGHATVRGVVLELPPDDEPDRPAVATEMPRLTRLLGRLPAGVRSTDLPWADGDALPPDLLVTVNLCLDSSAPTALVWGAERRLIYNQAVADMIPHHPQAFGAPAADWPEGWSMVCDAFEQAFATGDPLTVTDQLMPMDVEGATHDRYFTFALTPIRQDDGTVLALYAPATETTQDVQRRRRLATLHDLAAQGVTDGSIQELFARMAAALAGNPADIPFALMYLVAPGGRTAQRQAVTGLDGPDGAAPERLSPDADDGWPVAQVVEQGGMVMVDDVQLRFPGLRTVTGEMPTGALLAYADRAHDRLPSSLNVLGISTRQTLDVEYQQFLNKVVRHVQADLGAVAGAQLDRERSANLQRAMQSNRQIGAAIGILMTIHKVTEQQAFQLLSKASQQSNRKLREIADDVILSGTLPAETPPPGPPGQAAGRRARNTRNTR